MYRFIALRHKPRSWASSSSAIILSPHLSDPPPSPSNNHSRTGAVSRPKTHAFNNPNPKASTFSSGYPPNRSIVRSFGKGGVFVRSYCSGRESIEYDVVIVGAGSTGLAAAIRLKQLCNENGVDSSVCVVEKGAEVGAHILSGNVFEPWALDELLPNWKEEKAPLDVPVSSDKLLFLTKDRALSLPCPSDNKGNYVISLSHLVRWMGNKAEELGVEIYPGFAAGEILYNDDDGVVGIATNDMGIAKDGSKKDTFQRGVELRGRITLLAEGCRGSLSERIIEKYNLRGKSNAQHQTYALGIKDVGT